MGMSEKQYNHVHPNGSAMCKCKAFGMHLIISLVSLQAGTYSPMVHVCNTYHTWNHVDICLQENGNLRMSSHANRFISLRFYCLLTIFQYFIGRWEWICHLAGVVPNRCSWSSIIAGVPCASIRYCTCIMMNTVWKNFSFKLLVFARITGSRKSRCIYNEW